MITPRRTRLVRVADLHAFRQAVTELSLAGSSASVAARAVLVPTRGAARQLRRTFGTPSTSPAVLTREEFYEELHARSAAAALRSLNEYERDVLMQASARRAGEETQGFRLRPGLVAEILRFYDQLKRQARAIARFHELMQETLSRDAEYDRGAARMLAQTVFLTTTFRGYEQRVAALEACDEHIARVRALEAPLARPFGAVVVAVGDWIAEPNGLYLADFDLLSRLPGLESIDIVATTRMLASGFHQRLHDWLPGIEEMAFMSAGDDHSPRRPMLAVPAGASDQTVFVYRDREEELMAVARRIRAEDSSDTAQRARRAIVVKRPLPYLYLANEVFGRSGISHQASEGTPLGAEPFAAALDLVFDFVESRFTRQATIALLRSPHFSFAHHEHPLTRDAISLLDRGFSKSRYLGGLERLTDLAAAPPGTIKPAARPALTCAASLATELAPLLEPAPAAAQFRVVLTFLAAHQSTESLGADGGPVRAERLNRGRAAVVATLQSLAAAHAAHDNEAMDIAVLATQTRRWIGEQTFAAVLSGDGVQLVDDHAAPFGSFDDVDIVGLVEGEWPDRPHRNIFYPSSLLAALGWPSEKDRRGAEARFLDLLGSAVRRVAVSTITLDDDMLVERSLLVDEIPRAGLSLLAADPAEADTKQDGPERQVDRDDAPEYHGQTAPFDPRPWSVGALETYLGCPFRFFARYVLKLDEEPEDEEVMTPTSQGIFIHEVFQRFFAKWQASGLQAVTPGNLDEAREMFAAIVDERLGLLSETEAALERTRLLGSSVAAGLGEAVLRMEAERPVAVVERLLEHRLDGTYTFETPDGPRRVSLTGKADRIDLLADGTFRLIDYKLGWPPDRNTALQLPIYGLCAEQQLEGRSARRWTLGEAAYLAFKGPKRVSPLFTAREEREQTLSKAAIRLLSTVDAIGRGEFPPTPDDTFRCETCAYTSVCRKDYVGDV